MACPTTLLAHPSNGAHPLRIEKSKSGAKKRFSLTATGKVKCKQANTAHRLVSKPKSAKLRNRGTTTLVAQDAYKVKRYWLAG